MDTEVFLKAVNNAKQNPEDPNSVEFVNRIQQGKYNNYLKYLGKPTFENGEIVQPSTMDKVTNRVQQSIEHPVETFKGALKGAARTVVGTASGLQDLGQYGMGQVESAVTGKPLEETAAMQPGVGIDALKEETPQGQALQESLAPSNEAQAGGGNLETGAEIFYGGGKEIIKGGLNLAKKGLTAAAETPIGAKTVDLTKSAVKKGGEILQTTKEYAGKIKPKPVKTPEQILSTPADATSLKKLTEEQRSFYFSKKMEQASDLEKANLNALSKQMDALKAQDEALFAKKSDDANKAVQEASQKLDDAAYNEVQSLKPKLAETIRKNGNVYTDLIDKQLTDEIKNTQITRQEITSQINSKVNSADPSSVADAQQKIAFINKYLPEKGSTFGDLYEAMKQIRKENISKTSTRGAKVYNPDEIKAIDAISEIKDLLSSKGVDLTEANNFWSKNAEARDKLIKVLSPYSKTQGFESSLGSLKSFRKNITDRIQGTISPEDKSFLSAAENYLGQKFGTQELMRAFDKLSEAEKTKAALEIEKATQKTLRETLSENGINAAKMTSSQMKKEIENLKLTTDQKVAFRKKIQMAITYTLGAIGLPTIGYQIFKD